jgi:methyl-accepting chemotaxis protein
MSEASQTVPVVTSRYNRSAKNYLLDRHFQLKYTGVIVGITLVLSLALGALLWRTSSEVIEQGQATVERGKQVLVQSRKVSQVVSMNIAREYKDDPDLAKTFSDAAANDDAKLVEEQQRLERDATFLASQQRTLLVGLVALLGLLVVIVGALGIVFTHKVAGPIFKMKRLLRQVGEGKLIVRERLRRGDELQDFFGAFERMVEDLRKRQMAEIAKVDAILEKLNDAPVSQGGKKEFDEGGVALLQQLRREMQDQLDV